MPSTSEITQAWIAVYAAALRLLSALHADDPGAPLCTACGYRHYGMC